MAREVVDPALGPQLGHDGVDERVAGAALLPRRQVVRVRVPVNLAADGVALRCRGCRGCRACRGC